MGFIEIIKVREGQRNQIQQTDRKVQGIRLLCLYKVIKVREGQRKVQEQQLRVWQIQIQQTDRKVQGSTLLCL